MSKSNLRKVEISKAIGSKCPVFGTVLVTLFLIVLIAHSTSTRALTGDRKNELVYLLKQDCGSCHGMQLKGGLGPSLMWKNLHKKGKPYLKEVIAKGINGTAMPPWENILGREEITFLVDYLQTKESTASIATEIEQYDP